MRAEVEWAEARSDEEIAELAAEVAELRAALRSIANNTCCDRCNEAALVARAALNEEEYDNGRRTGAQAMTLADKIAALPEWPKEIERVGPYKRYAGHDYTVYDDGRSADTPYFTDLSTAALARLALARKWIDLCRHRPGCMYPCTCGRDALLKALEVPK